MNKYHNKKTVYDGISFDSKKEALRYRDLSFLEKAGAIQNLRCQVRFLVIPKQDSERAVYYVADFVYEENGKTVVEDVKGVRTDVYKIKRKLMLERYGIKILET